jgi:hypothetical protein
MASCLTFPLDLPLINKIRSDSDRCSRRSRPARLDDLVDDALDEERGRLSARFLSEECSFTVLPRSYRIIISASITYVTVTMSKKVVRSYGRSSSQAKLASRCSSLTGPAQSEMGVRSQVAEARRGPPGVGPTAFGGLRFVASCTPRKGSGKGGGQYIGFTGLDHAIRQCSHEAAFCGDYTDLGS